MRIAFISTLERFPWGGSEELWFRTAMAALKLDHQVIVSVVDWENLHPNIIKLRESGAVLHLRKRATSTYPKRFYMRAWSKLLFWIPKPSINTLFEDIIKFHPHVICISQGGSYDIYWYPALQQLVTQLRLPFFFVAQFNLEVSSLSFEQIINVRSIYNKANGIFFVSERNRQTAQRQLASSLSNSLVLFNPVNLTDISPLEWYKSDIISFACVARLDCAYKGQDILLQVLSSDIWRSRNWILNLYGQGPDEEYLKELVVFYGLTERINFCGQINNVREVWSTNHIQLMPSIAEGTPLALMEAMFCGRPAVATDVGGNADCVIENQTGFLAEAPSTKSFGAAMERAWLAKNNWFKLGQEAHELMSQTVDLAPQETLLNQLIRYEII